MKPASAPMPACIVLAAGFSSRLGRPKALVCIHGRSLLGRLALALNRRWGRGSVTIIVPPRSPLHRPARDHGWRCLSNPARSRGISSSIDRGLRACRWACAVLIVPVDLADIDARDLDRLLRAWRGRRRSVVARDRDGHAAIPLILPHRLFELRHQLRGDSGFRDLLEHLPAGDIRRVRLRGCSRDVDTTQDLQRARRLSRFRND